VEQLGYFGLKGMGLFSHLQIYTMRLNGILARDWAGHAKGLNNPPSPELGMVLEISRGDVLKGG
jgi:hypothetical protein